MKLDDLSRAFCFAGKPGNIDGSQVEKYVTDGRIVEVSQYSETDVINTYRIWLLYELFKGTLTVEQHECSEASLHAYVSERLPTKPYLAYLLEGASSQQSDVYNPESLTVQPGALEHVEGKLGQTVDLVQKSTG